MVALSNFVAASVLALLAHVASAEHEQCAGNVYNLDFDSLPRGTPLADQFKDINVTIHCDGTYGCRVFDTAVPVGGWHNGTCSGTCTVDQKPNGNLFCQEDNSIDVNKCGDPDLGSPNNACSGGGPGWGTGGLPTIGGVENEYANCEFLGNIMILDENGFDFPPDDRIGGNMMFYFDTPVTLINSTVLDNQGTEAIVYTVRTFLNCLI